MTWFGWLFIALQVVFWACGVVENVAKGKLGAAVLLTGISAALIVLMLTVGTGTGI